MKKIYLSIALLSSIATIQAQSNEVTGFVWQELGTSDGIYNVGTEPMIPGIVAELYNIVGGIDLELVSAAISDENGEFVLPNRLTGQFIIQYRFPDKGLQPTTSRAGADTSISSASDYLGFTDMFEIDDLATDVPGMNLGLENVLNKRTFCTVKGAEIPSWTSTLKLPKSNDGVVGVLTKVDLYAASLAYHPTISIENTAGSPSSANLAVGAQVTINAPALSTYSTLTSVNEVMSLPAFDGTIDFLGTSAFTWSDRYGVFVENTKVIAASFLLGNYRGTDSISIAVSAESATTFIGGGSFEYSVSTFASAGVCVVYTYEAGVLPVTFLAFDAERAEGNNVLIKWVTTAEKDNKGFYIESSTNGIDFKELGFVSPKNSDNNTNGLNAYDFTDYAPNVLGNNFYRIKQVDFTNQNVVYTEVKQVSFNKVATSKIQIFPNPVTGNAITVKNVQQYDHLFVFDYKGSIVMQVPNHNLDMISLNISTLSKGNYILKVSNKNNADTEAVPFVIK